jgi:hypothetical protein
MPAEACPGASKGGHREVFEIPGFRLALAIASLAGMTFELFNELKKHDATKVAKKLCRQAAKRSQTREPAFQ